jgi:hypothetical protein
MRFSMSTFKDKKAARGNFKPKQEPEAKPVPQNLDAEAFVCATFMARNSLFEKYLDRLQSSTPRRIVEAFG